MEDRRPSKDVVAAGLIGAICAGIMYYFVYQAGIRFLNEGNRDWASGKPREVIVHTPSSLFGFPVSVEFYAVNGLFVFPVVICAGAAACVWPMYVLSAARAKRNLAKARWSESSTSYRN